MYSESQLLCKAEIECSAHQSMFCRISYHVAYEIIPQQYSPFTWSETQGCVSFPHIHIGIKIPHKGNKGFIIWYEYHCQGIALKLSLISFSHSERIFILSSGLGFWLKKPILSFLFPAAPYEFPSPSAFWLCYWSTGPQCLASSICHFAPTVPWQAWPGQIAEQNMVSQNHKERKMRIG